MYVCLGVWAVPRQSEGATRQPQHYCQSQIWQIEAPLGPLRGWTLGAGWHRVGNRQDIFVSVPQRDSATLICIVLQCVRLVYTDMWKAYDSLDRCGYCLVSRSQPHPLLLNGRVWWTDS